MTERPIVVLPLAGSGSRIVPYYRLYHLNPHTGGISTFEELEVADDAAAEAFAEAKQNAHAMELWQQHRKVRRFDPSEAGSHVPQRS